MGDLPGSTANDYGTGIAVDSSGNAMVTGLTMSTDFSGHYNSDKGGDSDAFLAKVSPGGVLQRSAFVGGNSTDLSNGIVLDYLRQCGDEGYTYSTNFYTGSGSPHGGGDAFVAKFTTNAALLWATDLGGAGMDIGNAVTLDSSGNALVAGFTESTNFSGANNSSAAAAAMPSWPRSPSAARSNGRPTWVERVESGSGIAVDSSGSPIVTGYTGSTNFSGASNSTVAARTMPSWRRSPPAACRSG